MRIPEEAVLQQVYGETTESRARFESLAGHFTELFGKEEMEFFSAPGRTEIVGNHTRVKVVKNKVAPPFKEAEFDIMFGKGISREGDILDLAAKENIVEKSGAWYAYEGSKIGQGRENAKNFLAANPEICLEIENKVRVKYGLSEDTMMPEASKEAPTELPPVGVDAEDEK